MAYAALPVTILLRAGSTRGMAVPACFFASPLLLDMVLSEAQASSSGGSGGFTASLQQLANVATLPGIVGELRSKLL
jgi:RNA-splicing ligase RtcB